MRYTEPNNRTRQPDFPSSSAMLCCGTYYVLDGM